MANFTNTTSAVFIPEVWSMKTSIETESYLTAAKLVNKFDADVAGEGDTVNVPNVSNFGTAKDKELNTAVELETTTETSKTILIDKHKYTAFAIEDKLKKQSAYNLTAYYTKKAGYAVAKAIDTDVLASYADFTTTDAGSYAADISAASMIAAITQLMTGDVPVEDRAFIIHSTQAAALLAVTELIKTDYLGEYDKPTKVRTGPSSKYLWGMLYGIPVYYSTNVAVTAGTSNQTHNMLIQKEAIGLAMQQQPRVQRDYETRNLAEVIVTDVLYGLETIRPEFGVELKSK